MVYRVEARWDPEGGVRANPQRQRESSYCGESGTLGQHAQAVAEILSTGAAL